MTLERLLQRAAERTPDAVAVHGPADALTYAGLDELGGRVASGLRELGVKPGDRVGVWMHKSARTVAAMHGVLRLGAAYVPLDPAAPPARAATILSNCGVAALVHDRAAVADLGAALASVPTLSTNEQAGATLPWTHLDQLPEAPRTSGRASSELAYILYTSGSTGVPKGVCISHRNALAFVEWASREVGIGPEDRLSSQAPFHFDLSVFDLYCAFAGGASVHIVPEEYAWVAGALVRFVKERAITVWYSVPTAIVLMCNYGTLLDLDPLPLRTLIFAGEVFPVKHLRRIQQRWPGLRLLNFYGPTETNVCTYYDVKEDLEGAERPVPIGKAASGDMVWARKDDGAEAAVGEEGELCVKGPTVMLGYWGSDMTRADAVYPTGDLVRRLSSGDYDYVGRRDNMVKIRGFRVELGEIEATLLDHSAIKAAAVVTAGEGSEMALVAFLEQEGDVRPGLIELKGHCAARLPKHMIIHRAVFVPELPRTATGKIDRRRLTSVEAGDV